LKQFQNEPSIQHEPKSALIAESNGLALYEELLQQIKNILISQYPISLFLEIDPSQIHKMIKLVQMYIPNATIEIKKDLAGLDRVVIIEM
jgi:release factor glutamine methyltransferase